MLKMKLRQKQAIKLFALWVSVVIIFCSVSGCSTETKEGNLPENIDGYEYAEFERFNSYAEDNGLGGTKVYIFGTLDKVDEKDDVVYGNVKTDAGNWSVIFGYSQIDEIKDVFQNNEIYAFGVYSGYSDLLKTPDIYLEKVKCGEVIKYYNQLSDFMDVTEATNPTQSSNEKQTYILETEQIDYRELTKDEFANKVAEDFSTDAVKFVVDPYSEDLYILRPQGNSQSINVHIAFSDYGYRIELVFPLSDEMDECYEIFAKGLKSSLFGISFDDQIDILARYLVDEVNYKKVNCVEPFSIKQSKKYESNIVIISFSH